MILCSMSRTYYDRCVLFVYVAFLPKVCRKIAVDNCRIIGLLAVGVPPTNLNVSLQASAIRCIC